MLSAVREYGSNPAVEVDITTDGAGRITGCTIDGRTIGYSHVVHATTSSPISGRQFTYMFDTIGNRTADSGDPGVTSYAANNLNEYTSTTTPNESFTYDYDGNLTHDRDFDYLWDG